MTKTVQPSRLSQKQRIEKIAAVIAAWRVHDVHLKIAANMGRIDLIQASIESQQKLVDQTIVELMALAGVLPLRARVLERAQVLTQMHAVRLAEQDQTQPQDQQQEPTT